MKIIAIRVFKRFRELKFLVVSNGRNTKLHAALKRGAFGIYIIKVWYTCVQSNKTGKALARSGNDCI